MKKLPLRRMIGSVLLLVSCMACAAKQEPDQAGNTATTDEGYPVQFVQVNNVHTPGQQAAEFDPGTTYAAEGPGAVPDYPAFEPLPTGQYSAPVPSPPVQRENTAFKVYQYIPDSSKTLGTEALMSDISKEVAGKVFYKLKEEGEKHITSKIAVVSAVPLSDLKRESEFGRIMAEYLLTDLSDRGLRVSELRLGSEINILPQTGEFILSQNIGELANHSPELDYVVVTTFSNTKKTLIVQGRLVSLEDGMIKTSWRYGLPLNRELLSFFSGEGGENPFKISVRGAQQNTDPF